MLDLPDNPIGPYSIIELVSQHNIKSVRTVDDLGTAKWLLWFVYNQGCHRIIQESDLGKYKSDSDVLYRAFLKRNVVEPRSDPTAFRLMY